MSLSPTEVEIVHRLSEELAGVYAFLVSIDNDKILEQLNKTGIIRFAHINGKAFFVSKSRIKEAIILGKLILKAEGVEQLENNLCQLNFQNQEK